MSDDEYYGDDDVFTSDVLDNIPALNQPSSPISSASTLPNLPVQQPPLSTSTSIPGSNVNNPIVIVSVNDSAQAPVPQITTPEPARGANSRFSTIMSALRSGSTQRPSSGGLFGPPTGLLQPSKGKARTTGGFQLSTPQSSVAGPSRLPSQASPSTGTKRRRESSSAQEGALESEVRADTWSVMEEELTCAICYDIYVAPQITNCGHSACAPCLKIWLSRNHSCPVCRSYVNPTIKLATNRLASSMVDRLMIEAKKHTLPGWCPGGTKEAEWRKRKRLWVAEEARDAAAVQALNRTNTGVAAHVVARPASRPVIQPRIHPPQPLFLDDEDEDEDGDDDDDDYYIYGLGYDYDLDYDQYDQYD